MAKPKSRGNREGSVFRRVSPTGRVSWVAEMMTGYDAAGKRKIWRAHGQTRREVAEALDRAKVDLQQGRLVVGPRQTVGQFLATWLTDVAKGSTEPRTYAGYESIVRVHLIPHLGKLRLAKLDPQTIQAMYADLAVTVAPSTIRHISTCLHTALQWAVDCRALPYNPVALTRRPKAPKVQRYTFAAAEAVRFVAAAAADPCGPLYIFTLCTGLRSGEVLNLRWPDVDLERDLLLLTRARTRVPKVGLVEKAPKSDRGRAVPLIPVAIRALERQRECQEALRAVAGASWQESALIFTGLTGGPLSEHTALRRLYALLETAGLPRITFHDLRHNCATLLVSAGVDIKIISAILGHSTIAITADLYAQAKVPIQAAALGRLEALLRAPESDSCIIPAETEEPPDLS